MGDKTDKTGRTSIDITGKRIYLSGPMTGIEDYNRAAFDGAALDVMDAGADGYYSPDIDIHVGDSHEDCMLDSIRELTKTIADHERWHFKPYYDMLVSLPGWQDSAGARLEREVAEAIGMEVHDLGEVL